MGALSSRSSTPAGNATKGALKRPLTATERAAHARKWVATAKSGVLTAVLVGEHTQNIQMRSTVQDGTDYCVAIHVSVFPVQHVQ